MVGFVLGWGAHYLWNRHSVALADFLQLKAENSHLSEKYQQSLQDFQKRTTEWQQSLMENRAMVEQLSSCRANKQSLQYRLEASEKQYQQLETTLFEQFETIASRVLWQNSGKMNQKTQELLTYLLTPFREKLEGFEKKVEQSTQEQLKESFSLKAQISQLEKLNYSLSSDAKNLTEALKGDSKFRGNWGEVVLERILEKSGLQKNIHFSAQKTLHKEGENLRPDFVVFLPENKNLIIDSKLSLIAYEEYTRSEEPQKQHYLKQHVQAIETHIKSLSAKNYQDSFGIDSPDFVLMFIPIEPSFSLAVQTRPDLYNYALEKNIVPVTASTLLATLRMIESIWKQDKQNKNVLEIARQSGLLYDKFVGFVDDIKKIGSSLANAEKSYDQALKRLSEGRGNLIISAEKIRDLGAKNSKSLPEDLK